MNRTQSVVLGIATVISLSLGRPSANAQNFPVLVSEVRISTNHEGNLVYKTVKNTDLIRACAKEANLTNLAELTLVYNRTADALHVLRGTNLTAVCTPLTFSGGTWLINSNQTKAERLTFVMVETNKVANGTLAATERFVYGPSNELTSFSLSGRLQYSVPASGTNPPAIYRGTILAGTSLGEGEDEDEQGEHGEGHHGHGHGQGHGHGDEDGDRD